MTGSRHLIELKEIDGLPVLIEQLAAQAQCVVRLLQVDGAAIVEKHGKGPLTSANCLGAERCGEIADNWRTNPNRTMTCGCGHPMTVLPIHFQDSVNGLLTICPASQEQQPLFDCLASVITSCLGLARNAVDLWSQYSSVLSAHRELYRETESPSDAESISRVALQILEKYLNPGVAMYLPKEGLGWGESIIINRIGASEDWLKKLTEVVMTSHDEDRCPLIILPENEAQYTEFTELGARSFISATVFCENEILGRLVVCSYGQESNLTLSHLSLLEMLSDTIGLRIHDLRTREHKERFLNRALHHINTPAHSVIEIAKLLASNELSNEARQKWLSDLAEQTERLVGLSKKAREISILQRIARTRTLLSISYLLEEAVGRIEPYAISRDVSIRVDVRAEPIEALVDEESLHLALQSLLENAIKFSPAGGLVNVVLESDNENFRVSILDQGLGVPEAQRELVFEELVSIARGEVRESTGLGLTIAQVAIKDHGGKLHCADVPRGSGACFSFTIPMSGVGGG